MPGASGRLTPRERTAAVARVRRAVATAVDRRGVIVPGEHVLIACSGGPELDRAARRAGAARATAWLAPVGRARRPRASRPARRPRPSSWRVSPRIAGWRFGRSRSRSRRGVAAGSRSHRASRCAARRGGAGRRRGDRARPHRGRPGGDRAHARALRAHRRRGFPRWPSASEDWCARCSGSGARRPIAYCAALGIEPLDDPSNADPRFLRSRVRHEVIPALEAVFPGARRRLVVLAERQRRLADLRAGLRSWTPGRLSSCPRLVAASPISSSRSP